MDKDPTNYYLTMNCNWFHLANCAEIAVGIYHNFFFLIIFWHLNLLNGEISYKLNCCVIHAVQDYYMYDFYTQTCEIKIGKTYYLQKPVQQLAVH